MNRKALTYLFAASLTAAIIGGGHFANAQRTPGTAISGSDQNTKRLVAQADPNDPNGNSDPNEQGPPSGGGGFSGPPGSFQGGGFNGMPGIPMGGGESTQMAVAGNAVFILRGNTLYRINAQTLRLEGTGQLPAQNAVQGQPRPGGNGVPSPPAGFPGDQ